MSRRRWEGWRRNRNKQLHEYSDEQVATEFLHEFLNQQDRRLKGKTDDVADEWVFLLVQEFNRRGL